jgi:hypothetical protein
MLDEVAVPDRSRQGVQLQLQLWWYAAVWVGVLAGAHHIVYGVKQQFQVLEVDPAWTPASTLSGCKPSTPLGQCWCEAGSFWVMVCVEGVDWQSGAVWTHVLG